MDANAAIGIVQRSGLNKLRHVELDILWLQEQQARRLLPLRKVPGPLSPSDMMTKHVDLAHIEQYMKILYLKFEAGRASIAQQLHILEGSKSSSAGGSKVFEVEPANAHDLVRPASLGYKSGGGSEPSRGRSQTKPNSLSESQLTTNAIRDQGEAELNRLHIDNYHGAKINNIEERKIEEKGKTKYKSGTEGKSEDRAVERHIDSWGRDGKDGRWTRIHRSARRALFTPFKVAGGPGSKVPLKKLRVTRGKFVSTNKTFKIIDDWSVRANSHRLLEAAWIGTTDFR